MKLQFKHQKFQADAAKAVVDVFAGQPYLTPSYMMDRGYQGKMDGNTYSQTGLFDEQNFTGWGNQRIVPELSNQMILEHIQKIQRANQIEVSQKLEGMYNLTIEMEIGVGKTYTYIKTMVNVQQYQIVSTGNSFVQCAETYHQLLISNGILERDDVVSGEEPDGGQDSDPGSPDGNDADSQGAADAPVHNYSEMADGTIAEIRSANIDGTTYYYIYLENDESGLVYRLNVSEDETAVLLNVGDSVTLRYEPGGRICPAICRGAE